MVGCIIGVLLPKSIKSPAIGFPISMLEEIWIILMSTPHSTGVLDPQQVVAFGLSRDGRCPESQRDRR
jgi:hypothetical protein